MKRLISLALLGATTSLLAIGSEHAYLYKDPRIMAMGGVNVAVGGYSSSLFHNPAGLAKIKKDHGLVVDLLNIGLGLSTNFLDFADDMDKVDSMPETNKIEESAKTVALIGLLKKHSGKNFHLGVDNYTSISKNSDAFAWSIGLLAAVDSNFMPHGNGMASGGLLETTTRAYGGVVVGAAKPYETKFGKVDIGVGLKYISQTSIEGALGIADLLGDDDIADKLEKKFKKESTGVGLDLGATIHPFKDSSWNPSFGVSILNIGSMDMDDSYGGQPMTINFGASISPNVKYIESFIFGIDYVDVLNANNTRVYDYSTDGSVQFSDYQEADIMKRVRIGANVGLVDSSYFSLAISGGLYQGAYTAGIDMELTVIKLSAATYEEQIGTGGVDIPDRRYVARIGIGW